MKESTNPIPIESIPQFVRILIGKDATGTITKDESRDLVEWLSEDKSNWDLFAKYRKVCKSGGAVPLSGVFINTRNGQ